VTRARRVSVCAVAALSVVAVLTTAPAGAEARQATRPLWIQQITAAIGDRPVSVAIGLDGDPWYGHLAWVRRPPASNEKLLLSMALLNRFSPQRRIRTQAMAASGPKDGVLRRDLWLLGHGDPMTDRRELAALATQLRHAGLRHVRGSVIGATGPFARDWWATGWKWYFPADYVALPTAFTFDRNVDGHGVHITDPELRAARFMTNRLRTLGVRVDGDPGMGRPSVPVHQIGVENSPPLRQILHRMNVNSRNFFAEVLGKYLGLAAYGKGSIAAGARAIEAYTRNRGLDFTLYDGSGLSYANRVTAVGILHLLWNADTRPWGAVLRGTLARGGQGTLKDRFANIEIRAKTGTLDNASALSGWVYAESAGAWVEFSIVSNGFDEYAAKKIENQIVRIIAADATDPQPAG
jgi:D-alanyl-D-alanine carboxypeptidase/D-alanyl-D-alanine-endopeptidase (penicillin-binding protein 4)